MTPDAKNSGVARRVSANYIHPYLLGTSNTLVELDDRQADRLLALGASLTRVSPEEERKHWIARAAQLAAKAKPAAAGERKAAEALTAYEQGFMDKCAELGVTPHALLKRASVNPALGTLGGSGRRFLQLLGGGSKATRARYNLVDRALRQEFSRLAGLEGSRTLSADTIFSGVPKLLRRRIGGSTMHALEQETRKLYGHPNLSGGNSNIANKYIEALSAVEDSNDAAMRSELLKVLGARLGAAAGVGGVGYGAYKAVSGKKDK